MEGPLDNLGDHRLRDRRLARRSGLVTQQAVNAIGHEALLPAPDARLALARSAHDLVRPETVSRQQQDLRSPNMLLQTVPIGNDRFKPLTITRIEPDLDTIPHPKMIPGQALKGNLLYRSDH